MLDLKALLGKMLNYFVGYNEFTVTGHSTGTKTATYQTGQTLTITKSGYYPLGIVGWIVSGTTATFCVLSNVRLTSQSVGSGVISYSYRVVGTTTTPSFTIGFNVLWVKAS